jgi:hypothetical protein
MNLIFDAAGFACVWRELEDREKVEPDAARWADSVWLECNRELVANAALDTTNVRRHAIDDPAIELELVRFKCPRCGSVHESLRFR